MLRINCRLISSALVNNRKCSTHCCFQTTPTISCSLLFKLLLPFLALYGFSSNTSPARSQNEMRMQCHYYTARHQYRYRQKLFTLDIIRTFAYLAIPTKLHLRLPTTAIYMHEFTTFPQLPTTILHFRNILSYCYDVERQIRITRRPICSMPLEYGYAYSQ